MILGCMADDFTRVGDAVSFLQVGGVNMILNNGIPEKKDEDILEAQAMVIVLKARTCPPGEAVDRNMVALSWPGTHGTRVPYLKYCSTFDPMENGNIGPVLDVTLERWSIPYMLLCLALLENKRSVKDGKLYVNGVLLEDSSIKNHPPNPTKDSRLKYLMERQSRYPCFSPGTGELERGPRPYEKPGHYYSIPGYYEEKHGRTIAKQYGNPSLLSDGSGLLRMITRTWEPDEERSVLIPFRCAAPVILAGSCSEAARTQIRYYESKGGASLCIHLLRFMQDIQITEHIRASLEENKDQTALVYTSAPPDEASRIKAEWRESHSPLEHYNEELLAGAAAYTLESRERRIIATGGETSGAVIQKLEMHTFHIGRSIAPGVPIMYLVEQGGMELILKFGNFDQEDFFTRAAGDT